MYTNNLRIFFFLLLFPLLFGCSGGGGGENSGSSTALVRIHVGETTSPKLDDMETLLFRRVPGIPADVAAMTLRVSAEGSEIPESPLPIPLETGTVTVEIEADIDHLLVIEAQNQRGNTTFREEQMVNLPSGAVENITIALVALPVEFSVASQLVDAASGGVVTVDDQTSSINALSLNVPSGALTQDTTITVAEVYNPTDVPVLLTQAGITLGLGPDGTMFTTPVTLEFPYDESLIQDLGIAEADLRLFRFYAQVNNWAPLPDQEIDTERNVIIAHLTSLSFYTVGEAPSSSLENAPPLALDDTAITAEDVPVTIAVHTNDIDVNGDSLTVSNVTQAPHGTVALVNDTVSYTPHAHFNGTDTFVYTVSDGKGGSDTATVTVTVIPVNNAPVVSQPIADVLVAENADDTVLDLATTFSDPDIATNADELTLTVSENTNPDLVTVTLVETTLTLTYAPNQNGVAMITVRATDSEGLSVEDSFVAAVTYDDFSLEKIDRTKWRDLEFVRRIENGKLLLLFNTRFGTDERNTLDFLDSNAVTTMQADLTVTDFQATLASPQAGLSGSFYNDGTPGDGAVGDVFAHIGVTLDDTDFVANSAALVVSFSVERCDDPGCHSSTEFVFDTQRFGPIALDTTHTFFLGFDRNSVTFAFGFDGSMVSIGPAAGIPPASAPPKIPVKRIGTAMTEEDDPTPEAFIIATFDNVFVNGTLFDDFASDRIDRMKWANLELIRQIENGVFKSTLTQFGSEHGSGLSFIDPNTVTGFQAEVTVTDVSNTQASPRAGLVGHFYNDGTAGRRGEGDIITEIEIRHNGTELVAVFFVARCIAHPCDIDRFDSFLILYFDDTTFGSVAPGETHTLSLAFDAASTTFTFGFDDRKETVDQTNGIPLFVSPPQIAFKAIGTLVTDMDTPEEGASITATFDNVVVLQRIPLLTTTVVGRVVDQNGVGLAGASVTTHDGLSSFTESDGSFSIPDVPTNRDVIAVKVMFTTEEGIPFTGFAPATIPVPGNETDVGTIVISFMPEDMVIIQSAPFQIPGGMDTLQFEFNFLSNEFPDVGGEADDISFSLIRTDGNTVEARVLASANTAHFVSAAGSGFNGQTGFLTATFDISSLAGSGLAVVLSLGIRDVEDSIVDSAVLIDNIRMVDKDAGLEQVIPNGNFETPNFDAFTVSFVHINGPIAGIINGLGDVDNPPLGNFPGPEDFDFNNDDLLTTVIKPTEGSFMLFLSTGMDALNFVAFPPSVVVSDSTGTSPGTP